MKSLSFLIVLIMLFLTMPIAECVISIEVTPSSISYTGDPGSVSSTITVTINNTGTEDITSVEVYQKVTDTDDMWQSNLNGTSFLKMDDSGSTNYRYGSLRANTNTTQASGVTYPSVSADAKYGATNIVYETTAVGGDVIYRSVDYHFVFDYNTTGGGGYDKLIIDIDVDRDLADSGGYAEITLVPSSSLSFTEKRYDASGQLTIYTVGSYNIASWDPSNGTYIVVEYSDGSAYSVGSILVNKDKSIDVVFWMPNNVLPGSYEGLLYFVAS